MCQRSKIQGVNLSITQAASLNQVPTGSNYTYTITVTNRGPGNAHGVVLTDNLPANVFLNSVVASQGNFSTQANTVTCQLGTLTNNSSAEISIEVSAGTQGIALNQASIAADDLELDPADNQTTLLTTITNNEAPGLIAELSVPNNDLAYDPLRNKILTSLGANLGAVVSLDPATMQFGNPIPVGTVPGKLAISDDNHYLYVSLPSAGSVGRIDLASLSLESSFSLGTNAANQPYVVGDMAVVPGNPGALAVSLNDFSGNVGVAIFDNGVIRPSVAPKREFGGTYYIGFSTNPATLYSALPFYFRKLSVDSSGVHLVSETTGLIPGNYYPSFKYDNGRVYFDAGPVINPEASTNVGTLPVSGLVAPNAKNGRVYFVTQGGNPFTGPLLTVRAFDNDTYAELWSVSIPPGSGGVTSFIRLGTNGIALGTDANRVFVIRTPLL